MEVTENKKVCIIGAGPRGLVTARHLSTIPNLEIVVFEAKEDIGGLWFLKEKKPEVATEYSKDIDNYNRLYSCQHDSMYETLITNLPYFLMEYKDLGMLDVDASFPLFISMSQYKRYLDAYAEKFDLRKYIKFSNLIKSVRLSKNLSEEEKQKVRTERKFVVKTVNAKGSSLEIDEVYHEFDYVVVTSGQYSLPNSPKIPGDENFKGKIIHYKNFGSPNRDLYRGKRVLIVGGSDAAYDMLIQFFANDVPRLQDCERVILCSKKVSHIQSSDDFKDLIEQGKLSVHKGSVIQYKHEKLVCFSDGTEEEVDTVVYATGFKPKFPYLNQEIDKIIDHNEEENRGAFFGPLYKKMISIREPDLFFVGYLETALIVNILPELQAMAIRYILEGKLKVPSQEEMLKAFNEEVNLHMKEVGDLTYFYRTDLSTQFPEILNNYEHTEWLCISDWLKTAFPENNKEKADEFFDLIAKFKKAFFGFKQSGNFLQYKKFDYHQIYPRDFRNTTEFV